MTRTVRAAAFRGATSIHSTSDRHEKQVVDIAAAGNSGVTALRIAQSAAQSTTAETKTESARF